VPRRRPLARLRLVQAALTSRQATPEGAKAPTRRRRIKAVRALPVRPAASAGREEPPARDASGAAGATASS
jgi:hypothetical protein